MKRVAILISGGGSNMVRLIEDMTGDHPARPVGVIASDSAAGGLARATALGVDCHVAIARDPGGRPAFEDRLSELLHALAPDIVVLAGFMRVLSPAFVADWRGRMLNVHPSLLPLYPGLQTHARAIAAGDAWAGATVHEVTAEVDGGPVLGQARVPVLADDTPATLAARVLAAEHVLYPAVLRRFAAGDRTPLMLPWAGAMG